MTEQLPAGRVIHPNVWAMNTPAELHATHPEGHLAVTLDPVALYVRNEGQWVPLASVAGNIPAPTVFVASEQRGLGDLMARYFDRIDPEGRDLYGEWTEIPPSEVLERQLDSVEALIPEPDSAGLIPPATATT